MTLRTDLGAFRGARVREPSLDSRLLSLPWEIILVGAEVLFRHGETEA